jgi:hypothetical protein
MIVQTKVVVPEIIAVHITVSELKFRYKNISPTIN